MTRWFYCSSPKMTVAVAVNAQGVIVESAPIVRKFIGQPSINLGRWMRTHGECVFAPLKS